MSFLDKISDSFSLIPTIVGKISSVFNFFNINVGNSQPSGDLNFGSGILIGASTSILISRFYPSIQSSYDTFFSQNGNSSSQAQSVIGNNNNTTNNRDNNTFNGGTFNGSSFGNSTINNTTNVIQNVVQNFQKVSNYQLDLSKLKANEILVEIERYKELIQQDTDKINELQNRQALCFLNIEISRQYMLLLSHYRDDVDFSQQLKDKSVFFANDAMNQMSIIHGKSDTLGNIVNDNIQGMIKQQLSELSENDQSLAKEALELYKKSLNDLKAIQFSVDDLKEDDILFLTELKASLMNNVANVYIWLLKSSKDDLKSAKSYLDEAIKLSPNNVRYSNNLIKCNELLSKSDSFVFKR